jgi:uncharacterized protein YdeI (YjbR/CyaY-like superfamily)
MSKEANIKKLRVQGIADWRAWLKKNHESQEVVWLVFQKKGQGDPPFDYHMALDEALCYGWVDSLLRAIDEKEYMRKFTPRKPTSTWSEINKKKVEQLVREGRMTPAGMRTIQVAKENGMWDKGVKLPEVDDSLPGALLHAFQTNQEARDQYFNMSRSRQRPFNIWINMAKRAETIQKRVSESVRLLENGEELGLK